jgi:hypothetical protein
MKKKKAQDSVRIYKIFCTTIVALAIIGAVKANQVS